MNLPQLKYFFELEVTSTQDAIVPLLLDNPDRSILLVSERQTRGRGRKDLDWQSPNGGLWMTLAVPIPQIPSEVALTFLHYHVAVETCTWLRETFSLPIMVKWPNDLVYLWYNPNRVAEEKQLKKLGGILIELLSPSSGATILIGLGVNILNPANGLTKDVSQIATSLTDIMQLENRDLQAHHPANLTKLAKGLGTHLYQSLTPILAPDASAFIRELRKKYHTYLTQKDRGVIVEGGGEFLCRGITTAGKLDLVSPDGTQERCLGIADAGIIKKIYM